MTRVNPAADFNPDEAILANNLALYTCADVTLGSPARKVAEDAFIDLGSALLREVEQTLLPRRLSFQAESGDLLQIEVSDRRIFQVVAVQGPWTAPRHVNQVGQLLTFPSDSDIAALQDMLNAFVAGHTQLSVRSRPWVPADFPAGSGVSLGVLRHVMTALPDAPKEKALIDFISVLGFIPIAFTLLRHGAPVQTLGSEEDRAALHAIVGADFATIAETTSGDGSDQLVVLVAGSVCQDAPDQSPALLLANSGPEQLLLWLNSEDVCKAVVTWINSRGECI
jgi:hypothetical protein